VERLTSTRNDAASLHDMTSATSNGHFANELGEQRWCMCRSISRFAATQVPRYR
jgi:hypothetical protein